MQGHGHVQLWLAKDRIRERIEEASRARQVRQYRRPSLRRSVGRSIIRVGQRLAADPSPLPTLNRT